ncbi:hypothetical protein F444_22332 [Phytophthora nicotianae P1976]|uniref:Uncharacterized protein n=1 Tax=Phytophthora nicotianae P1976 TaxID=1317066 RepID=A0A080YY36_PHYNI|nr:hypothetical protein F444_22332 [Phytophthora nicotianae P1976]
MCFHASLVLSPSLTRAFRRQRRFRRPHILTSSSPRSAARRGPAVVSTVELADPSLDLADVRASLSALQQAIDQTEALRELRSNHEALRREFLASRRRVEDLDRQIADAANAASPYVLFCQHKYDMVRHKLESTRTERAAGTSGLFPRALRPAIFDIAI